MDQLIGGAPIPKAEVAYKFKLGKPLVTPEQLQSLPTQMYKFHERYMEMSAKGREMFGARISNSDFLQGEESLSKHKLNQPFLSASHGLNGKVNFSV